MLTLSSSKSHTFHISPIFPCSLDLLGPIFADPTCPEGLAGHAATEQNEAAGVEKSAWAGEAAQAVAWKTQHGLAQRRFGGI